MFQGTVTLLMRTSRLGGPTLDFLEPIETRLYKHAEIILNKIISVSEDVKANQSITW